MDLVFWEVERANEGLGLRGALALEGLRTPECHKNVWVEWRRIDEKERRGPYKRTPLLKSFLGSWTTPLDDHRWMTTFSMSNTESTVEAKMNSTVRAESGKN